MNPVRITLQGSFTDDYKESFYVDNWRVKISSSNLWELQGVMQWLSWRNHHRIALRLALV